MMISLILVILLFGLTLSDTEKVIEQQEAYIIELQATAHNLADKAQDYQTQILELQQDKQLLMQILSKSKLYEGELKK